MIPEEVIAEIRSRADIVAVIGQHVALRKAGRNWKGLCPFHGEKTPSFNVAPDKGFFYCFGCRKKGDVFTFVMELEGKSFMEAAEQLAARAGMSLPRIDESPEQRRARGERSAMLELSKAAAEIFRENLRDKQRGTAARAYLESRAVGEAISERFLLGYGLPDWHAMADALRARRLDVELALRLGLVARQPKAGGYYDRFRDRLVCPVVLPGGDVVGFSARILPSAERDDAPKYINSPESLIYKKSKLLFGLAQARDGIASKGRAVLVEGNFDVISLHQAGLTETVAPLGTALTSEQVEQLRRLAGEVVLCYDGDRAGRTATRSALELLVAADVPVRVVALPDGEDPDSMVRRDGGTKLTELVERAAGGIEYFCFDVWGKSRANADARARALDDAARLVAKVANPTKRDLIVGTLASAMELDVQVVRKAVSRQQAQGPTAADHGSGRPAWRGGGASGSAPGPASGNAGQGRWDRSDGRSQGRPYQGHPNAPGAPSGGSGRDSGRDSGRGAPAFGARAGARRDGTSRFEPRYDGRFDDLDGRNGAVDDRYGGPDGRYDDRDDGRSGEGEGFIDDRFAPPPEGEEGPTRPEAARASSSGRPPARQAPPPTEEAELLALVADHPALLSTADADKAFSLLTDARLRDMYSAARQGQSMLELAHSHLPQPTLDLVLSGKYAAVTDPRARLIALLESLTRRAAEQSLRSLGQRLAEAKRSGDRELERRLVEEILSTRK